LAGDRHFFATKDDLLPGLQQIELKRTLKYVLAGKLERPERVTYDSLLDFPQLGTNLSGSHVIGPHFLVMDQNEEPVVETVPQQDGGVLYFLTQLKNATSIVFWPGGLYEEKNLICGHINTASDNKESLDLFRDFSRTITRDFKKIGSYFVGPKALVLMSQGVRMVTISIKSPREYDLRIT
jgi:hypothetical protein